MSDAEHSQPKIHNSSTVEQVSQYLTTELQALNDRAVAAEQNAAGKVNFYLLIVTAAIGGIALLLSSEKLTAYLGTIAAVVCVLLGFLFLVGLSTFYQVLDLAASATFFYRRAGRIRRWFLDLEPAVLPYLPFKAGDDNPVFLAPRASLRGIETVLLLINSAVLGVASGLGAGLALNWAKHPLPQLTVLVSASLGLAVFALSWILHVRKVRQYLAGREQEQREKNMSFFPSAEYEERIDAWRAARGASDSGIQVPAPEPDPTVTRPAAKSSKAKH